MLSFTHAVAGPTVGRTLAEHGADVLCATRPNDYEHEFIYAEANVGSRSAYVDLDSPTGQERAATLLAGADVVVNNHRLGSLERRGLDPRELAERHPGLVYVSVNCYGSSGPWAGRGGFDMNGSAASGLMTIEGSDAEPRLPVTVLINDYITGYMGAIGAMAALVKRATEGGSWHVTVSLTRTAMWCGSLGLVDPALAGSDEEHSLREPLPYDAPSPLGDVHMLAPPVRFSRTRAGVARPGPRPAGVEPGGMAHLTVATRRVVREILEVSSAVQRAAGSQFRAIRDSDRTRASKEWDRVESMISSAPVRPCSCRKPSVTRSGSPIRWVDMASSTIDFSAAVNGYSAASSGDGSGPRRPERNCRMLSAVEPESQRASASLGAHSTDTATMALGSACRIEGRKFDR